jgi:symplekin
LNGINLTRHSDALLVTATLNGLGGLVRLRPTLANRIINAILNFNPFKLANSPMTSTNKVMIKSMEKTVVVFLANFLKRNPQNPLAPRIEQHILRLQQVRKDIMEGAGLKRPAADEPTDGLDQHKRQRLGANVSPKIVPPPLPPGPISYAQLFSLTEDPAALNTNVTVVPMPLAAKSLVNLLRFNVDKDHLTHAINSIRERYSSLSTPLQPAINEPAPLDDEEDDYEPDYQPEDAEQIKNRLEVDSPEETKSRSNSDSVGPYKLPQPPQMSPEQIHALALATLDRMFDTLAELMASQEAQDQMRSFQEPVVRGAIDRHAYFRMIVRVAVRSVAGLETAEHYRNTQNHIKSGSTISDHVRQRLLQFILRDWQKRIANVVTWFTEEWVTEQSIWKEYTERLSSVNGSGDVKPPEPPRHYKKWVLRFLEDLSAYLGGGKSDMRVLVRFVSEIPFLDAEIINRVATLAKDPERVTIVGAALRYLIQYRPPAKEICLDALQTVWQCKSQSVMILKYLPLTLTVERMVEGPNAKLLKALRPVFVGQMLQQKAELKTEAE